jgi:GT2 family glycosyltransferase
MIFSLSVQSVIYGNNAADLLRSLDFLVAAIKVARTTTDARFGDAHIIWGDCSQSPRLCEEEIYKASLVAAKEDIQFSYRFFSSNLGSAGGHNQLFTLSGTDLVLILNPDTIISPNALLGLLKPFGDKRIGLTEARQIPIEHPKNFDPVSLDTSWASTACALARRKAWEEIDGFDAKSFFLYCDDVDFSWRMRLKGYRVIYCPNAVIFHDKRLNRDAKWIANSTEAYYSAEAALMLAHKYSRNDLVEAISKDFCNQGNSIQKEALAEFEKRKIENRLPIQIDSDHRIAQFIGGFYAKNRY